MKGKKARTGQRKQKAFLSALSECGIISQAAEIAKMSRSRHYDWLKEDPEYEAKVEEAIKMAAEKLEAEARRRAVDGVDEPVFYRGEHTGHTIKRYSDTLLIFLLKGALPDKYADRQKTEMSGTDGGPIKVSVDLL